MQSEGYLHGDFGETKGVGSRLVPTSHNSRDVLNLRIRIRSVGHGRLRHIPSHCKSVSTSPHRKRDFPDKST